MSYAASSAIVRGGSMGNRYCARKDEFDWTLGARRRLRRYLKSDLTYSEVALLLGTTKGAVAGAVDRYDLQMSVEQQRDHKARQAWERAKHGGRSKERDWDSRLIETWAERKARLRSVNNSPARSTP